MGLAETVHARGGVRPSPFPFAPTEVPVSHGRGGTVTWHVDAAHPEPARGNVEMMLRVIVAFALFALLAALAWWLERRRRTEGPTQTSGVVPGQLDRTDFARPEAPWLVVLFTSSTCDSCAGLYDKAAALESDEVAVTEVEYFAHRDLHARYHVDAAPMTLITDAQGVVRGSFLGAFAAPELWTAVAELRAS
jgi:hypothetical protein